MWKALSAAALIVLAPVAATAQAPDAKANELS